MSIMEFEPPKVSTETNTKQSQGNHSATKLKPTDINSPRLIREAMKQDDDLFRNVISILNRIRDQFTLIKKYDFQSCFSKQIGKGERTLLIDFVICMYNNLTNFFGPNGTQLVSVGAITTHLCGPLRGCSQGNVFDLRSGGWRRWIDTSTKRYESGEY